jgi:glycosyltransferase involved in cell wall biosynthesis
MNEAPLVSCIIPVWNCEAYLSEAIDSVLGQTYRPFELIVIDDGSTDGTPAVIARHGDTIRALRQPHSGTASARNAGVAGARGELLAFLDADDVWEPAKLARQVDCLALRPRDDICVVGIQNFWVDALAAERDRMAGSGLTRPQPGYNFSSALVRRGVFDRIGPFDPALKLRNDRLWFVRARDQGIGIAVIPDVMVRRRIHFSNLTRRSSADALDELFEIARSRMARPAPSRE